MVDPNGNRIAYTQTTDEGVGIFVNDGITGKRKLLHEFKEGPFQPPHLELLLPWSPDGGSFAYLDHQNQSINLFHADNDTTEVIPFADLKHFVWPLGAVWLNASCFVYVDDQQQLHTMAKQLSGQWENKHRDISAEVISQSTVLMAMPQNRICWFHKDTLWTLDMSSSNSSPTVLYRPSPESKIRMKEVSYPSQTGEFLLSCFEDGKESVWKLSFNKNASADLTRLKMDWSIQDAKWINGGKGYAYMRANKRNRSVVLQTSTNTEPIKIFAGGKVNNFFPSADGKKIVILGLASNEFAPSIWKYDIETSSLDCSVPCAESPFKYVKNIEQFDDGSITNKSGRKINIRLCLPANFGRKDQSYPLIIVPNYMHSYCPAFANCGAVCAFVDRDDISKEAVDKWQSDVLDVYKHLVKNQFIDSKRVFLIGTCAETEGISDFAEKYPSLWKGVILLSAIQMPDAGKLASAPHTPKVLINTGSGYGGRNADQIIKDYQKSASEAGVNVKVSIYGGATHWIVAKNSMRERMQAIMQFIYED